MFALTVERPTAVELLPSAIPTALALAPNYPDPFSPSTTIRCVLPEASVVTLRVCEVTGQQVATLANGEPRAAGSHAEPFDASALASGVCLVRLEAGAFHQVRRMTVLK